MYITHAALVAASAAAHRARRRQPRDTDTAETCKSCRAGAANPRRLAQGLDDLMPQPTPLPGAIRVVSAARLFSEGNGYLPGQIVDRIA